MTYGYIRVSSDKQTVEMLESEDNLPPQSNEFLTAEST